MVQRPRARADEPEGDRYLREPVEKRAQGSTGLFEEMYRLRFVILL